MAENTPTNGEAGLASIQAFMADLEGQAQSDAALKALQRLAGWLSVVRACGATPVWPEGDAGDRAREAFEALLAQQAQLERLLELTRPPI